MNEKKSILKEIYDFNETNNAYKLEIKVLKYQDLFNSLDPAPLRKRDLDSDFVKYLEDFSADIPLKDNIQLEIYIPDTQLDDNEKHRVKTAIKSYYSFMLLDSKKKNSNQNKESAVFILISVVLLFVSFYISGSVKPNYFLKIIIEGFNIGGWVFFWEALNILIFKKRKVIKMSRIYKRILDARVSFVDNKNI